MARKKFICPKCGNDYLELRPYHFVDFLFLLFNSRIRRFRCLQCMWEGRLPVGFD